MAKSQNFQKLQKTKKNTEKPKKFNDLLASNDPHPCQKTQTCKKQITPLHRTRKQQELRILLRPRWIKDPIEGFF